MKDFYVYDQTGRIHSSGSCPPSMLGLQLLGFPEGCMVGEGSADCSTHWVRIVEGEPVLSQRKGMNIGVAEAGLTIIVRGLPVGTTLAVDGQHVISDGDPVEIEFDIPDTYTIFLSPPPQYLDEKLEVTVG